MTGTRSALIVATYEYDDQRLARLRAPERDAQALADVLANPDIGGFEVTTVLNRPWHEVSRAVASFFRDRHADDLVLLHFSCHGLKDESGELYFAAADTTLDLLEATAVSSSTVNRAMDRSRAGRVLLFLDCCYSGAFARGMTARAAGGVDVNERLGGRGRAVITASTALQFAFEGDSIADGDPGATAPSVFTTALVEGLRTGEADRDLDGWVSLDELYTYVHEEVTRVTPDQTPTKWAFDIAGDIRVAKRGSPVSRPAELPQPLTESMNSLFAWERSAVLDPLGELFSGAHPGRALAARMALEEMAAHDDSDRVRTRAREVLATGPHTQEPDTRMDVTHSFAPVDTIDEAGNAPVPEPEASFGTPAEATYIGTHEARSRYTGSRAREAASGRASLIGGPRPRRRLTWVWLGLTAVLVATIAVTMWVLARPSSPDGRQPSTSADEASPPKIPETSMVMGRHSGDFRELIALDSRSGATRALDADPKANRPAVSPDRTEVAYLLSGGSGPGVVRVVQAQGPDRRDLLNESSKKKCPLASRPAWSPDSRSLALTCFDGDRNPLGIWVTNREGTRIHRVLKTDARAWYPTWGGDDRIYFVRWDPEGSEPDRIYRVEASGKGEPERATDGDGWESNPDWGESGLLYVSSKSRGKPGDIYIHRPEGTFPLTRQQEVNSVAWSPDEKSVALLAPFSSSRVNGVWVAKFSDDGAPDLLETKQLAFSGKPGVPSWRG